jgi:tRNA U34 5-carboxymethylaminomethyl modifying enzyme MnmG/GidA
MRRALDRGTKRPVSPQEANRFGLEINLDGVRRSAYDLLSYPNIDGRMFCGSGRISAQFSPSILERLEIEAQYAVYLKRQAADIAAVRKEEQTAIPEDLDYGRIAGLSNELKQKLKPQAGNAGGCATYRGHHAGGARIDHRSCAAATPRFEPCRLMDRIASEIP